MIESLSPQFVSGAAVALSTTRPPSGDEQDQASLRAEKPREEEGLGVKEPKADDDPDRTTGRNVDTYA